MRRPVVPFLLSALCLASPAALAQQKKSKPRSSPTALPMPPPPTAAEPAPKREEPPPQGGAVPVEAEETSKGMTELQLAVEGFAGGLFHFSSPTVVLAPGTPWGGGTVVGGGAPPMFRWGGRMSSPFYRINPTASLEWLATVALGHTGFSQELLGMTVSAGVLGVELLPGLRARFAVLPQLSLTGEVGCGLQLTRTAVRVTFAGETAHGSAAGMFRIALGGRYTVDEKLSLFFEPVGVHAYVGQGSAAGWSLQAGFAYAL